MPKESTEPFVIEIESRLKSCTVKKVMFPQDGQSLHPESAQSLHPESARRIQQSTRFNTRLQTGGYNTFFMSRLIADDAALLHISTKSSGLKTGLSAPGKGPKSFLVQKIQQDNFLSSSYPGR